MKNIACVKILISVMAKGYGIALILASFLLINT